MQDTILQSIGRTPLVRLQRMAEGLQAKVYVKVESQNPDGSIKDRVAVAMITEAERRGWLRPGSMIIEATAGSPPWSRGWEPVARSAAWPATSKSKTRK